MKTAGIVAEYNPFHRGHQHLAQQLRRQGFDALVAVMSPAVTQRGEFALLPTAPRAEAALRSGIDLVIELPAPYALRSAEGFGEAAVSLLAAAGAVDALGFGSESGDARRLHAAATALHSEEFKAQLRLLLGEGAPYPIARQRALAAIDPALAGVLASPNDILAAEYCAAIVKHQYSLQPAAILRRGAGHDTLSLQGDPVAAEKENDAKGAFLSGKALRELWKNGQMEAFLKAVPAETHKAYTKAFQQGKYFVPDCRWDALALGTLRMKTPAQLAEMQGFSAGLENALAAAAASAGSFAQLLEALPTKRHPRSRLRRLALNSVLDFQKDLPPLPPYLHILGATDKGRELLKEIEQKATLPLSHSLAGLARHSAPCAAVAACTARAADLQALLLQTPAPAGSAFSDPFLAV